MKRCMEIAKECVEDNPYKRPTIAEIVLKLNETETKIQKAPPVVNEPTNDPRSSLCQVWSFKATFNDYLSCWVYILICSVHIPPFVLRQYI